MAEVASAECLREESCECADFIQYLEDVEADILDLELATEQTEQLPVENETQENRGLETMMTYFMALEEELVIEKQKVQRLQKLNQEMEKDRLEAEERNRELIKQKYVLEIENQQLRQKLWRMKDLFTKSADELWQLRRQNRMLHEILQMNNTASVGSTQTLQAHQRRGNSDDQHLDTCVSEPNMQHLLHNTDDNKEHSSLLHNFISVKQAQLGAPSAKLLQVTSTQLIHEATTVQGSPKSAADSEEIPIMPAPLPKDFILLFGENSNKAEITPKERDMNKLEERNSNLFKALQKLEMQHSELKSHHDRINKMFNNIKRQDLDDHIRTGISRRRVLARKTRNGCNAKEEELLKAVKSGCSRKVREAISEGADVNLSLVGKWTPLHIAAAFGHVDICEQLLDAGALKLAVDRWGDTPLHWAAVNGHQEVASILAHRGADVSKRGRGDTTPRERALAAGHGDLAEWFAKKEQEKHKSSTAA